MPLKFRENGKTYVVESFREDKTYIVGDTGPAGGKVFYDRGSYGITSGDEVTTPWRYLEYIEEPVYVAKSNIFPWGDDRSFFSGAEPVDGFGLGLQNTLFMWGRFGNLAEGTRWYNIAMWMLSLRVNGYNDWYVPSLEELEEIYNTRTSTAFDSTIEAWSSVHNTDSTAYSLTFSNGATTSRNRAFFLSTIPVRRF